MRRLISFLAILGSACSPAHDSAGGAQGKISLRGKWTVTAIDDMSVEHMPSPEFDAGEEFIRWEPGCAQLMFLYQIDDAQFRADRIRYMVEAGFDPAKSTPPPCGISLSPDLEKALSIMALARSIEVRSPGTIRISGASHSLTMSHPDARE